MTMVGDHLLRKRLKYCFIRQISHKTVIFLQVNDTDCGSGLFKSLSHVFADALSGTGDNYNFAVKSNIGFLNLS